MTSIEVPGCEREQDENILGSALLDHDCEFCEVEFSRLTRRLRAEGNLLNW